MHADTHRGTASGVPPRVSRRRRSARSCKTGVAIASTVAAALCLAAPAGAIRRLATLEVPEGARTLQVVGDLAYVGAGIGLRIVDVADPAAPVEVGATGLVKVSSVEVNGRYAFVATLLGGLSVLDVSSPSAPREIASLPVPGNMFDMDVSERFAYVITSYGIRILDLRNPRAPRALGYLEVPGYRPTDVEVVDSLAYVISYDGLRILDVSDPSLSVDLGLVPVNGARGVTVAGALAFVATPFQIAVIDVSRPTDSREIARIDLPDTPLDMVAVGNLLFTTLDHGRGLRVFDFGDPTTPIPLGVFTGDMGTGALSVVGDRAYLTAGGRGFQTFDVSLPTRPAAVSTLATPGNALRLLVEDGTAYVDDVTGLAILDVRNPVQPELLHRDPGERRVPLAVRDHLLYVAASGTLRILDVHDPIAPAEVGSLEVRARSANVSADGELLYVVDTSRNLVVVDVSDPARPRVRSTTHLDYPVAIAVGKGYLYVSDNHVGLVVIDASDPDAPYVVGQLPPNPFPPVGTPGVSIALRGDRVYLGTSDESLLTLDVSDPMAPVRLGALPRGSAVGAGQVVGERLYGSDGATGVHVVDISDPSHPVELGGTEPLLARSVAVTSAGAILAAAGDVVTVDFGPEFVKHYVVPVRIVRRSSAGDPPGRPPRWRSPSEIVSVTLFGSERIHAEEVDVASLALGPDGAVALKRSVQLADLDRDGLTDVGARFRIDRETAGADELCLSARAIDGSVLSGCGSPERGRCGFGYATALPLVLGLGWAMRGARSLWREGP